MGEDQAVEILLRRCGELDNRQPLELVERDGMARARLIETELRPFEGTRNPIEQRDEVPSLHVGFVDRPGKERSGKRSFLRVRSLCEKG